MPWGSEHPALNVGHDFRNDAAFAKLLQSLFLLLQSVSNFGSTFSALAYYINYYKQYDDDVMQLRHNTMHINSSPMTTVDN